MAARALRLAGFALLLVVALSGCRQDAIRADGGDSLGSLGQLARKSPADVYVQLAAEYMRENNLGEALKNAKKGVNVDSQHASAHYLLGLIYQRLGEHQRAEVAYKRSIKLDQRDPFALNAYASFLCSQQRYADADRFFRRAVDNALYKTPWIALTNAGLCAQKADDLPQAEVYLRRALSGNSRFAPALLAMAKVSLQRRIPLSTRAYLQRYQDVARHTPESLWLGIQAEQALGDRDQVASYALQLQSRFPDSKQVQLFRESRSP